MTESIRDSSIQTIARKWSADRSVGCQAPLGQRLRPDRPPVELTDLRALLTAGDADIYRRVIPAVDRVILAETLGFVDGNQVHASELLGISRTTLRAKLTS